MVFTEREFSMLKRAKLAKNGGVWINLQTPGVEAPTPASYVIVADGEGLSAAVIADGDLHEAVHKFMCCGCCCLNSWRDCDAAMRSDIEQLDKAENWTKDEDGQPFSMSWPHETGKITIYKLSAPARASVVEAPREATPDEIRNAALEEAAELSENIGTTAFGDEIADEIRTLKSEARAASSTPPTTSEKSADNTTTLDLRDSEEKSEAGRVMLSGVQDHAGKAQIVGGGIDRIGIGSNCATSAPTSPQTTPEKES